MNENTNINKRPRFWRRRFWIPRFSMRFVLVLFTAVAVWFGWMSNLNRQAQIEKHTVESLAPFGCLVIYDYQWDEDDSWDPYADRPESYWLNRLLLTPLFDEYPFVRVEGLILESAEELETLKEVGKLSHLKRLSISYSEKLKDLNELGSLKHLESLKLYCCQNIESLGPFKNCRRMKDISIVQCGAISNIDCVANFAELTSLEMIGTKVTNLKPLRNATKLKLLELGGMVRGLDWIRRSKDIVELTIDSPAVINFDAIGQMTKIEKLSITSDHLKSLDFVTGMKSLKSCDIRSSGLVSIEGLRGLSELKYVGIFESQKLSDPSALRGKGIEHLVLRTLSALTDFSSFQDLEQLTHLDVSGCGATHLTGLSNLPKLDTLIVQSCRHLQTLDGVEALVNLKNIELDLCTGLQNLDRLGGLAKLEMVGCYRCDSLTNIEGLRGLKQLRRINFSDSKKVVGGEFLLDLDSPNSINLRNTGFDEGLIEKLRVKFPRAVPFE